MQEPLLCRPFPTDRVPFHIRRWPVILQRGLDPLSIIMILDRIKTADGMSALRALPEGYFENLSRNVPPHLNKLLADVITLLLKKIKVPDGEIDAVTEKLYVRRYQEMFTMLEDYDVRKTRLEGREEERRLGKLRNIRAVKRLFELGMDADTIANILELTPDEVIEIQDGLS